MRPEIAKCEGFSEEKALFTVLGIVHPYHGGSGWCEDAVDTFLLWIYGTRTLPCTLKTEARFSLEPPSTVSEVTTMMQLRLEILSRGGNPRVRSHNADTDMIPRELRFHLNN